MSGDPSDISTLDPAFFAGRYLIEIVTWDWGLHVGLASVWKYVDIQTVDDPLDRASVTNFWFSRDIHANLFPWIEGH